MKKYDRWHMTHDTLWEVNIVSRIQLPSSYGFGVKAFLQILRIRMTDWINPAISNKGICRTALDTPGLLINLGGIFAQVC